MLHLAVSYVQEPVVAPAAAQGALSLPGGVEALFESDSGPAGPRTARTPSYPPAAARPVPPSIRSRNESWHRAERPRGQRRLDLVSRPRPLRTGEGPASPDGR